MSADKSYASLDGERPVLIPPGDYELAYLYHETKSLFRRHKLYVWFKVLTLGEHFEKRVCRYYGVRRLIGRAGENGRFAIGWKSDFLREYALVFGAPSRMDRIAMAPFEKVIVLGRVRTVDQGADQRDIPNPLRYSVVDELLGNAAIVGGPGSRFRRPSRSGPPDIKIGGT